MHGSCGTSCHDRDQRTPKTTESGQKDSDANLKAPRGCNTLNINDIITVMDGNAYMFTRMYL